MAYVMAVVTLAERPAAASFTAVPRSLAAALSPMISGAPFATAGFVSPPLVACGVIRIAYDLALWRGMRGASNLPANWHLQPRRTTRGASGLSITRVSRLAGPA